MAHKSAKPRNLKAYPIAAAIAIIAIAAIMAAAANIKKSDYQKKADILKQEVQQSLKQSDFQPDGNYIVFVSTGNGKYRANVYTGTGPDFKSAWDAANKQAAQASKDSQYPVKYVKCDVVSGQTTISSDELTEYLTDSMENYCFYGIAFDKNYTTALLEAECNAAGIYNYETGLFDLEHINSYLSAANRLMLQALPQQYILFETYSWFCDEDDQVYRLSDDWNIYGRREISSLDADAAAGLIQTSADYLLKSMDMEAGKFNYTDWPQFDRDDTDYNVVRHAGVIWGLIDYYRITNDTAVQPVLQSAIEYMLSQVKYKDSQTAYLYDVNQDEISLGGNSLAVIALSEYMTVFGGHEYLDVCNQLGNGILSFVRPDGGFYHIADNDFNMTGEYVTTYYDGEAALALCMMHHLTQDTKYLDAARAAADYFASNHYELYGDHWISYAMNELTRICPDEERYYTLALGNIQNSLQTMLDTARTSPVYLELLMAGFETYQRYVEHLNPDLSWFDTNAFLLTIRYRADMQLNGYFWPEYAMYMASPDTILGAFYTRNDDFRVRMDDVQHNIGGYYLYWKNYDALVTAGMPETLS